MSFVGVQFDKMRVTPAYDGMTLESIIGTPAVKVWGGVPTIGTGLTVTIPPSAFFIRGRHIRLNDFETVHVPANFTGSIVITVDLTKTNDSSGNPVYDNYSVTNNQVYFRAIATNNIRTEDVNAGGKVYDLEIASVTTSATAITSLVNSKTRIMNTPQLAQFRARTIASQRTYEKIALNNVTVGNKYSNCNVTLRRCGNICFAKINFRPVTTLAWEQLLDINKFNGYRPDGGDYGGILNEMSYNTDSGGAYIAGTNLRIMHVGRTDVKQTTYSGVVTYVTADDYPNDADIVQGFKMI